MELSGAAVMLKCSALVSLEDVVSIVQLVTVVELVKFSFFDAVAELSFASTVIGFSTVVAVFRLVVAAAVFIPSVVALAANIRRKETITDL